MHEPDMITAFDECVERVLAGEPVERVLQDYPTLAAVLRPMLEATLSVRRSAPPVPAAAKARVGARVMQAADRLGYGPRTRRRALPRLTWAAAVLAVMLFAGLLSLWLRNNAENASAPSPTFGVTVTAIGTQDVTPTQTLTWTPSMTAAATLLVVPTASPTPSATVPSPPDTPMPSVTASPVPPSPAPPTPEPCQFVVSVASANLRSGPGTGYPVIGVAYQGERLPVLSRHVSGTWYEVARAEPPLQAWVAASVGELAGACDNVPVSDMPLLSGGDASGGNGAPSGGGEGGGDGGFWGGDDMWTPPPTPDMGGFPTGGGDGMDESYEWEDGMDGDDRHDCDCNDGMSG